MRSSPIERFLREIDASWTSAESSRLRIDVFGAAALTLRAGYDRGTKDVDVLETASRSDEVKRRLVQLAGKNTELSKRHAMYLDVVAPGIPFLPRSARWHPLESLTDAVHFEFRVLDVVDVAVSKLRRFSPQDRFDIEWCVGDELVSHAAFVDRFRSAVDSERDSARAEDLPKVIANFHAIEREAFAVRETEIDLPDWI